MTRLEMIQAITNKLRQPGPNKKWSLGDSYLQRMTDEELKAKYREVCNNG